MDDSKNHKIPYKLDYRYRIPGKLLDKVVNQKHYKSDGTPRFATHPLVDGGKTRGVHINKHGIPMRPDLLDWDLEDSSIPEEPKPTEKKRGWISTILWGILYIFIYGAARGEVSKRKNNGNLPNMRWDKLPR